MVGAGGVASASGIVHLSLMVEVAKLLGLFDWNFSLTQSGKNAYKLTRSNKPLVIDSSQYRIGRLRGIHLHLEQGSEDGLMMGFRLKDVGEFLEPLAFLERLLGRNHVSET